MNCPALLFDLLEWRAPNELNATLRQLREGMSVSEIREIEAFLVEMSAIPAGHVVNIACAELQNSLIMVPDDETSLGEMFTEMLREFRDS